MIAPAPAVAAAASRRGLLLGWLAALATVVIWALWMVGTRHAVTHDLPPAAIGILRFGVPALVLAPVWWRLGLWPRRVPPLVLLGLLGSGAPFFFIVANAMRFAPAPDVGPLLPGTMPLFVALIGFTLFGERLERWRVAGFALIAVAVLCIGGRGLLQAADGAWRGHGLLLVGAFLWGLYTHAYRRSGLTPAQGAALVGTWSFLMLLPFGAMPLATAVANGLAGAVFVQALLQGLISGVGSIILYGIAIDRLGASRAAAVSPIGPVLAVLLAIPVLGEWPDVAALVGLVAATGGVMLATGVIGRR
ncbi:MAG TPA: DMT family transporter [Microvirga sp.]|jgi:drug/metabolite transporter (DMT)-like permease|nr:DMT family transporter [Microvirga sp.]